MSIGVEGLYKIGELAERAGVNRSAIDHYTRLGLIEPATRSEGSYRLYSDEALERIKFINRCKRNRLSLSEIREAMSEEPSLERAELSLRMAHASIAIDEALHELKDIDARIGRLHGSDTDTLKQRAGLLALKVVAISELLQMMSQQL